MSNTAVEGNKDNLQCPSCGAILTEILVHHNYTIEYSEEQEKWVKSDGDASYLCVNCMEELDIGDIEDILRQVDEL